MTATAQQFKSASFDEAFIANYRLELHLAADSIHFAVSNQLNNPVYLALHPNPNERTPLDLLNEVTAADPMLAHKYESAEVFISADPWIAVPQSQLMRGKEGMFLEVLFDTNTAKDPATRDDLEDLKLSILYTLPEELQQALHAAWPQYRRIRSSHIVSPVLRMAHKIHIALKGKPSANVEVFPDYFIYTVFEQGKLRFCNRFYISTEADVLYYVMSVNQNLGIDPAAIILYVTGYSPLRAPIEKLMESQFKHFAPSRKLFPQSVELNEAGFFLDEFSFLLIK
ncbi:MAG: DUF3822 family protein [Bacteroidetes bacterium]|nr:DUF3822 family protein [Bacteroidota bacterium]